MASTRSPSPPAPGEPLRAARHPESSTGRSPSESADRPHRSGRRRARRGPLRRTVAAWGWRAVAVPVLVLCTILVLVGELAGFAGDADGDEAEQAGGYEPLSRWIEPAPAPFGHLPEVAGLPAGAPYEESGTGTFRVVPGVTSRAGAAEAELFTYTVEVEDGIDTTPFGGDEAFGRMVDATLAGPQGWTADGAVAFQRVEPDEDPTFRVSLTAPLTVRELCGYTIEEEVSCFNGLEERALINVARWTRGARSYEGDIGSYRQYVINHEVGHGLGYPEHEPCPEDGAPAPIMMQQTLSVRNSDIRALEGPGSYAPDNDDTCVPNGLPFAPGAALPESG